MFVRLPIRKNRHAALRDARRFVSETHCFPKIFLSLFKRIYKPIIALKSPKFAMYFKFSRSKNIKRDSKMEIIKPFIINFNVK